MSRPLFSMVALVGVFTGSGCLLFAKPYAPCESQSDCTPHQCVDGECRDAGQGPEDLGDGGAADGGQDGGPTDGGLDAGGVQDAGHTDGGLDDAGGGPLEPEAADPPSGWFQLRTPLFDDATCFESGRLPHEDAFDGECDVGQSATWRVDLVGPLKSFVIKSQFHGDSRCLSGHVDGLSEAPGIRMQACDSSLAQTWRLIAHQDQVRLKNALGGVDLCLTNGGSDAATMAPCEDAASQLWTLAPVAAACSSHADCGANSCDFYHGTCSDVRREQYCTPGFDDDGDGLGGCADPDCTARGICFAPLAVPNFSFEVGTPPPAGPLQPEGWTCNDGLLACGVESVVTTNGSFDAAAVGDFYHFTNLPQFGGPEESFTLSDPNEIGVAEVGLYRLTVAVGHRINNFTTEGNLLLDITAAGENIGRGTVRSPKALVESNAWRDFGAAAAFFPNDPTVGGDLRVRITAVAPLVGDRSQAQFDNVRLERSPFGTVTVLNASFENTAAEFGAPGWEAIGQEQPVPFRTVVAEGIGGFGAGDDGTHYLTLLHSNAGGLAISAVRTAAGTLGTVQSGAYALVVAVGNRIDQNTTDGEAIIQLFAGDRLLAQTSRLDPEGTIEGGEWTDVIATVAVQPGSENVGEGLSIRLVGIEDTPQLTGTHFDNVRLFHVSD